jgi:hypothetical protein
MPLESDDYDPRYVSDKKCRTCGRTNCEGGAACEVAAEMRGEL